MGSPSASTQSGLGMHVGCPISIVQDDHCGISQSSSMLGIHYSKSAALIKITWSSLIVESFNKERICQHPLASPDMMSRRIRTLAVVSLHSISHASAHIPPFSSLSHCTGITIFLFEGIAGSSMK